MLLYHELNAKHDYSSTSVDSFHCVLAQSPQRESNGLAATLEDSVVISSR